jgi:RNA polymerase sigma-70 factor, ECF subfamily
MGTARSHQTTGEPGVLGSRAISLPGREAFAQLVEPHRRQLKAHCYRMVGSLHEAEDLVQETFLRAWQAFDNFEGRGPLKVWLFQIATRACLDALRQRKRRRRILPEAEFPPTTELPKGEPPAEIAWLEPYPQAELDNLADEAPNPEARYERREAVRLAFVAAVQHLPPRQRAVLLLVDVLGWSSSETALLVGGSAASVNSALQRARATLGRIYPTGRPHDRVALSADQGVLLDRYVRAWEEKNLDGFIALLKQDATYAMPPWGHWYLGRDSIRGFFDAVWKHYSGFCLLPTRANGNPAFALYAQDQDSGQWQAHSLQVLNVEGGKISQLTAFVRPLGPALFSAFGFPPTLGKGEVVSSILTGSTRIFAPSSAKLFD